MKTPVLFAGSTSGPTVSAIRYAGIAFGAAGGALWLTTDTQRTPVPINCTLSNLEVNLPVAQGAGHTSTLTLMKGAVATALAVTVDENSTRKSNTSDTVSITAGTDDISWKFQSGAEQQGVIQAGFLMTASVSGESAIFGAVGGSTDKYAPFGSVITTSATEVVGSVVVATAGVIDKLYIIESVAPGTAASGKKWTYTVYKNGSTTGITCECSETQTTASDLTHSISVVQGDLISLARIGTSSPASSVCRFGARWVPTISGESLLFVLWDGNPTSNADRFGNANGIAISTATETNTYNLVPYPCVIKKQALAIATAPGTGGSGRYRQAWLRTGLVGGSQADTTLTCQAFETGTTDTENTEVATISASDVTTGALIDIRTNTSTVCASSAQVRVGMVAYIAPDTAPKMIIGGGISVAGGIG